MKVFSFGIALASAAALLLAPGAASISGSNSCSGVADPDKVDCGFSGIDQSGCEAKGCCWVPSHDSGANLPWCFFKKGDAPTCPLGYNSTGEAPFSAEEVATMRSYFLKNINVDGSGAVVAAPDYNTPGGSYYYHWMRDGALSTAALLKTAKSVGDVVEQLDAYVGWVSRVQKQQDPFQQSVLVEPKFYIPNGTVYTGGWCRPQNDGPGLRASSLIGYANALSSASTSSKYTAADIWKLVQIDLDWLVSNWQSQGCDLWEEIRSDDLFWDRFTMRASLTHGAAFAKSQGDASRASSYAAAAKSIEATLQSHYASGFIMESTNRQKDSATICAINNGYLGDGLFKPSGAEVAGTIAALNSLFCTMFEVNQADTKAGIPGILYGRYEGDSYAGGNPWILLSASLAEVLYSAASEVRARGSLTASEYAAWAPIVGLDANSVADVGTVADAMAGSADGVLIRIRHHVKSNGFHLNEQLNRGTGVPMSASDLTWSYAATLKAIHARDAYRGEL